MSKQHSNIHGQFVPIHHATLDSEAWRALSHGAKVLYIALRRRIPRGRNEVYLSQRKAEKEIGSSRRLIAKWFRELEHYGFIVMSSPGCLGVEGKGKAPHWRLTECGTTSKTSATGVWEPPTKDYLRWDGTPFHDPKTKPRRPRGSQGGDHGVASRGDASSPPNSQSGDHGVAIQEQGSGDPVVAISSKPLGGRHGASTGVVPLAPEISKRAQSAVTRDPWTKPRILSEEFRDFDEFPLDEKAA